MPPTAVGGGCGRSGLRSFAPDIASPLLPQVARRRKRLPWRACVGRATPIGEVGATLRIASVAPSAALGAVVGPDGLRGTMSPLPGGEATFASEVTVTAAETFLEIGAMTFGDGHRLRVTTVGSGYLGSSADPALQQGAVIWRVEAGEGQFAGASGLVCGNVLLRDNGQIVAHPLGLIFVPESGHS